jgi:hypothetical protein
MAWLRYVPCQQKHGWWHQIEFDYPSGFYRSNVAVLRFFGIVNLTQVWQTGVMKTKTPSYQRHRFPSDNHQSRPLAVPSFLSELP